MQDNLSGVYVNGGKQYLLNQLCDTYKYFVAEDLGQLDKLLKELSIIYNTETNILFDEFFKAMNNDFKVNDLNSTFWERIVNSSYDNKGIEISIILNAIVIEIVYGIIIIYVPVKKRLTKK